MPVSQQAEVKTGQPLPGGRGTDQEYAHRIQDGRARQRQFTADFVAHRRDPRSLVRTNLHSHGIGLVSLELAVQHAKAIVYGCIRETVFTPGGDGGTLPFATSHVLVHRVLKGSPGKALSLRQSGGPALCSAGGPGGECLIQDETNELVLPGDEVVLLLWSSPGLPDALLALPEAGVFFIKHGRVVPEVSNRFATSVTSLGLEEFLTAIRSTASP